LFLSRRGKIDKEVKGRKRRRKRRRKEKEEEKEKELKKQRAGEEEMAVKETLRATESSSPLREMSSVAFFNCDM
jgi:hypothetical protein